MGGTLVNLRIAIISDIHGNGIALDAALADVQQNPVDQIVCLGDAMQDEPQPAQVAARSREIALPMTTGQRRCLAAVRAGHS